ncbi:DUF6542 domain-containing protein [Kitasatospora sp. NPDC006697]|uniref:DUF6542 domain-containing protein n=1 Tax=Kitasatospora sp. NPDC006697 TaxID=3364020 RepID=UPI00367D04F5
MAAAPPGRTLVPALFLGIPALGALVDEAIAPGLGLLFAGSAVLGTASATALASRAGWWWVLPACPIVVLAVTAAAELLGDGAKYRGGNSLLAGAIRWAVNGFPVMLAALAVAALVVLVRILRDRRTARHAA